MAPDGAGEAARRGGAQRVDQLLAEAGDAIAHLEREIDPLLDEQDGAVLRAQSLQRRGEVGDRERRETE